MGRSNIFNGAPGNWGQIKRESCSPAKCDVKFKDGVLWLEQELMDFMQDSNWDDMPCSKIVEKMASIIANKIG